ncbi:MAG: secretin and TonB N-terminal domain-containing protein [Xenococcaceae cyanobacterium MO_188.B19]|nr:secretin and TonB N-terminal domain-containing protein [Xenococcaceae cyanobacterium MO_188.B19]
MKKYYRSLSLLTGSFAFLLTALPTLAATQKITGVEIDYTLNQGVKLKLETNSKEQNIGSFLSIIDKNNLETTLINGKLELPQGKTFSKINPAPGIAKISLYQVDENHTKIAITTKSKISLEPNLQKEGTELILNLNLARQKNSILNKIPIVSDLKNLKQNFDKFLVAQRNKDEPKSELNIKSESFNNEVLVPNPEIIISNDAVEYNNNLQQNYSQQPYLPRAVAPPVGDIAVSNISTFPDTIQLGSNALVPRLVLRDAPVREVLSLLARQAGLNIVFAVEEEEKGRSRRGQEEETVEGPTVSLDLENQSVQEVFDSILLISGLNASRRGNIIYVGEKLPAQARNLISRTLRLNQVRAENAALFLASQGAQGQRLTTEVEETVDPETGRVVQRKELPATLQDLGGVDQEEEDNTRALLLKGLQVSTDDRLNSITLVGEPRRVEMATAFLTQLDARRRQVAVNVKVIDINLNNEEFFNSSFSFGVNDTFVTQDGGTAIINFGDTQPANAAQSRISVPSPPVIPSPGLDDAFQFPRKFLLNLEAEITSRNAKILTDPTLVVQEGQQATVKLAQNVVESIRTEVDGDSGTRTITPVLAEAGLIVTVNVERIDDNGFVALSVSPTISAVGDTQIFESGDGASNELNLLTKREISSGLIRLRDNQTLILSGIIQDQERNTVSKVPILGDIPLLGALFRQTNKDNERAEVVVLLTPQIIDEQSNFGYDYTPGKATRDMLRRGGLKLPGTP